MNSELHCDELPKLGDVYSCSHCKFSVLVVKHCNCDDVEAVVLVCCDGKMDKVN